MELEKKEVFLFHQNVLAGETVKLEQKIRKCGRVKNIKAGFIEGEDGELKVNILAFSADGMPINLINQIGDLKYLNGNNYEYNMDIDVYLKAEEKIVVVGKNDDGIYIYPLRVQITFEYEVKK